MPQITKPLRGTWSSTDPVLPKRGEENENRRHVDRGRSFLATAVLICKTRFGVFKMAGLQSGQPYGVSVWRDEVAGGYATIVAGVVSSLDTVTTAPAEVNKAASG